mmetsp:Transcript_87664/g.233382  ORF Transcript_87664/g.233382 Transcript_87664/m.233382 type:complete len:156 (-) Transcript_87664:53-520(-)
MMIAVFIVEVWRENFLIVCLDIDKKKIDGHLKEVEFQKKKQNGEGLRWGRLRNSLLWHNRVYYYTYLIATVLWLVNFISSAVLVFRFYYLDGRTGTVFFTNNLLLLNRFIKGFGVASNALSLEQGISFYFGKQVCFNKIDPDYKNKYDKDGNKVV